MRRVQRATDPDRQAADGAGAVRSDRPTRRIGAVERSLERFCHAARLRWRRMPKGTIAQLINWAPDDGSDAPGLPDLWKRPAVDPDAPSRRVADAGLAWHTSDRMQGTTMNTNHDDRITTMPPGAISRRPPSAAWAARGPPPRWGWPPVAAPGPTRHARGIPLRLES